MKNLLIIIMIAFYQVKCLGQQIITDTVTIGSHIISFPKPGMYHKSEFKYEEGNSVGFVVSEDMAIIDFIEGAMIVVPPKDNALLISSQVIDCILTDNIYQYSESGEVFFQRILHIIPYNLYVTYNSVTEKFVQKYNNIFDNLKIYTK